MAQFGDFALARGELQAALVGYLCREVLRAREVLLGHVGPAADTDALLRDLGQQAVAVVQVQVRMVHTGSSVIRSLVIGSLVMRSPC
jgi:hypothetical protein